MPRGGWAGARREPREHGTGPRDRLTWDTVERLLAEMAAQQEAKVVALARGLVPGLTTEDVRNPHDFPPLVESAAFNYEDGILAGLRAAEAAVRAARRRPPDG